jgi:hypothetical protein
MVVRKREYVSLAENTCMQLTANLVVQNLLLEVLYNARHFQIGHKQKHTFPLLRACYDFWRVLAGKSNY